MRMTTDDTDLAFRAAGGDAQAFRVLLERHYDRIFRLAFRCLGDQTDAEDVAQDVCVDLPRKLATFRGSAKFTSWLYRLVLNRCRDFARARARAGRLAAAYGEVRALTDAEWEDTSRRLGWLHEALETLGDDLRETAILVLAEDMTHADAAEVFGIKESTVSWRMHEIRKKLKALAEAGDGGQA